MSAPSLPWQPSRLPAAIDALRAYDPGHDLVAWRRRFEGLLTELGSNENPLGPSPNALAAASAALTQSYRYPDPLGGDLKRALGHRHAVEPAQIVLGNGSHEILMQIAQAFVPSGAPLVYSQFGFAVFGIAAAAAGARAICVPALPDDHALAPSGHDLAALAAACDAETRVLYLANPNNPTGTWFEPSALAELLARVPVSTLVVVDEAYQECQPDPDGSSALRMLGQYRNLLVTRTFSKVYGLAGLRVGYAIGAPEAIAVLERLRESFNVNNVALAAAEAALDDQTHVENVCRYNETERARVDAALRDLGLRVWPSRTNFVLAGFGTADRCRQIETRLCERGVILRPMTGYGLPQCLRISIGSVLENGRLIDALRAVM